MWPEYTYIGFKAQHMGFDAHLTVMYLGRHLTESDAKCINGILDEIGRDVMFVERNRIEIFRHGTPVVTVTPIEGQGDLYGVRKQLEDYGLESKSEFDFNPHITLKMKNRDHTIYIPKIIRLDHLGLY